jgi:hypothetical protein
MSGRTFGKRTPAADASADPDHPDVRVLIQAIAERRGSDPLICEKTAGDEMLRVLTSAMARQDERGVHAETLIAALAGLAGYACLVSARAVAAMLSGASAPLLRNIEDTPASLEIDATIGADGRTYASGRAIDRPLFQDRLSVWNVILGSASAYGVKTMPDVDELLAHVSASVGTEAFGRPRLAPGGYPPREPPVAFVRAFWLVLLPKARLFCPLPEQWPVLYAFATQQAIALCREAVPPEIAMRLALESAVPMSRLEVFG